MSRKSMATLLLGFALGIAACAVMGFTNAGGASAGNAILVADGQGGCYYRNDKGELYNVTGKDARRVKTMATSTSAGDPL